jgi:3-(3-hydroxy-phenyl)propionate hydroxylase
MTTGHDCDVLIVGGGPTGVTLAILLAQQGVRTIIAEKEPGIYPLPRAAHIDHEAMRILQQAGVADAVMATCRHTTRYDFLNAKGEILLRFDGSDRTGSGGWPAANFIHQPSVEQALRAQLAELPDADLRSGWRMERFETEGDGVIARFDTPEGPRRLRSRYLVGADGARSPVRHAAGIAFDDLDFDEPWLVIDAIVHDHDRLPKVNLQICDPSRPTTCVLMGEGRHRWEFMIKPGETAEQVLDDGFIAALLAPWDVDGAVTLERKAVYRFNARIATRWRQGRILIAGDAAHQMPPFAGQGLCSGLRDAANLGWKLPLVVNGRADPDLLDTYQPEREPHVRGVIAMAMMMGKTVCITDPDAAAARDEQMLAARAAGMVLDGPPAYPPIMTGCILAGSPGAGSYFPQLVAPDGTRLDDRVGPGAWLVSDAAIFATQGLVPVSPADGDLSDFAAGLRAELQRHACPAILVRPDRSLFGAGTPEALSAAWHAALQPAAA